MAPVGKIRRRASFRALARPEGRATRGPVTVAFSSSVPEIDGAPLVAYAIGRRTGPAVTRNRLRRRLRAAARQAELAPGAYLVRAEASALEVPFDELCEVLGRAATAARRPALDGAGRDEPGAP